MSVTENGVVPPPEPKPDPRPPLAASKQIELFFHCKDCMTNLPFGTSPRDFARYEVGYTPRGIQVWCIRHDQNILNIDFEGHRHPAITRST